MRNQLRTSAAAAMLLLSAAIAQAAPPELAEGMFIVVAMEATSIEPVGQICLVGVEATFALEGTFEGLLTADFRIVHLGPCDQPADEIFFAEGTFVGEVDGASGSFDFIFRGDIDDQHNAEGDLVVLGGTGELADLRGRITLTGITGVGGEYVGAIKFVPPR